MMLLMKEVVCLLVLISAAAGDDDAPAWAHYGATGPLFWSQNYDQCARTHQSPIDITDSSLVYDENLDVIEFINYDEVPESAVLTLANTGHSATVSVTGEELQINSTVFDDAYQLDQFHFHWGADDTSGSEHTINSYHYPLELHLVHHLLEYDDFAAAANASDHSMAVLGFMFEIQEDDNPDLSFFISKLSDVTYKGESVVLDDFALGTMLPDDLSKYYRYLGSFTTPPCYESVLWTVFTSTIKISAEQMDEFRQMRYTAEGDPEEQMVNNYRPVLPHHDRTINVNWDPEEESSRSGEEPPTCGSNALSLPLFGLICSLLARFI